MARPAITFVPWPVRLALAMVFTGRNLIGRIILGDPDNQTGQDQTDTGRAEDAHGGEAAGIFGRQTAHEPGGYEIKGDGRQDPGDCQALIQRAHDVLFGSEFYKVSTNDGGDNRNTAQKEREFDPGTVGPKNRLGQQHGGHQGYRIGFIKVGGHAGAVAHIVAHVVGDNRRVPRVVFRNAGLNLTNQVGADVSRFGINTAGDTGKDAHQGTAEAQTDQGMESRFSGICPGNREISGQADDAQTDHHDAGDRTALK